MTTSNVRINTWESRYAAPEVAPPPAAPAADQPAPAPVLPHLQPISSVLARQLQHEQQQRKRLYKQLRALEWQLQRAQGTITTQADSISWLEVQDPAAATDSSDDPLFSSSTPPSVQQLQRLLVHRRRQLQQASSSSISDVARGEYRSAHRWQL